MQIFFVSIKKRKQVKSISTNIDVLSEKAWARVPHLQACDSSQLSHVSRQPGLVGEDLLCSQGARPTQAFKYV
jgi:hypothetical protein